MPAAGKRDARWETSPVSTSFFDSLIITQNNWTFQVPCCGQFADIWRKFTGQRQDSSLAANPSAKLYSSVKPSSASSLIRRTVRVAIPSFAAHSSCE